VGDDGGGVAGEEVLAVADADDEGRAATGADHDAGLIDAETAMP
jgi:hypothetical protein